MEQSPDLGIVLGAIISLISLACAVAKLMRYLSGLDKQLSEMENQTWRLQTDTERLRLSTQVLRENSEKPEPSLRKVNTAQTNCKNCSAVLNLRKDTCEYCRTPIISEITANPRSGSVPIEICW